MALFFQTVTWYTRVALPALRIHDVLRLLQHLLPQLHRRQLLTSPTAFDFTALISYWQRVPLIQYVVEDEREKRGCALMRKLDEVYPF